MGQVSVIYRTDHSIFFNRYDRNRFRLTGGRSEYSAYTGRVDNHVANTERLN